MSFKLRHREGQFPPNGFYFKDSKTGMEFKEGDFYGVVRLIIAHRKANPRLYPPAEAHHLIFEIVSAELDAYTCERLKNSDRFCESGEPMTLEPEANAIAEEMNKECYRCGNKMGFPLYCKSCHGQKLSGFICTSCKAPLGRS